MWAEKTFGTVAVRAFVGAAFSLAALPAWTQDSDLANKVNSLPWRSAPAIGSIGSVAQISLTRDLRFLDANATSRFLELNGNPPRTNQYALAPRSLGWFAIFAFDGSGYVRDDEKLDADELLRTLRSQNESSISERKRLNLPILKLVGWAVPPHYDIETRHLEWGTRLLSEDGEPIVNYTIKLLGRSGVMNAILVSDPESLDADIREFKTGLKNFDYVSGERYSEYRQGDKVAEYGLAALIVGGAAAAAAQSGVFKGFGKLIGVAVFGGLAAIGAFFRKIFSRG
jgi:uncharacterized membrane-anchored protein